MGPAGHEFREIERRQFRLWDYGWLAASRFDARPAGAEPREVIASLLGSPVYRRDYAGGDADTRTTHGPFRLDRMGVGDFVATSFLDVRAAIHARFHDVDFSDEPPDADQTAAVDGFLDDLSNRAGACFRLALDREDPDRGHAQSYIHWLFDEYLVFETDGSVWVLVVGYD